MEHSIYLSQNTFLNISATSGFNSNSTMSYLLGRTLFFSGHFWVSMIYTKLSLPSPLALRGVVQLCIVTREKGVPKLLSKKLLLESFASGPTQKLRYGSLACPWPFTSPEPSCWEERAAAQKGLRSDRACLSYLLFPTMGPEAPAASGGKRKGPR